MLASAIAWVAANQSWKTPDARSLRPYGQGHRDRLIRKVWFMLGEVEGTGAETVARLHGDLDLVNVDELRELLDELSARPAPRIVIDLGDVPFIDVLSLSVILGAADALRDAGRQLFVEGASNSVRRLCAVLNAEDILAPQTPLHHAAIYRAC
jgi:anti-anti-sigma factor